MWLDPVLPQMLNEVLYVMALVSTQGLRMNLPPPHTGEQLPRRLMLSQGGVGDEQIHAQTAPVLHEGMAAVAELGRLAVAFSHELRVRIGGALVGSVGTLLALKQALRRNRRAARPGVKAVELRRNGGQCRFGQFLHPAQRVIGRNPGFDREIVKH